MTDDRPNVSEGDPEVLKTEILRTVVGSGVHGMAIEGTDDHDEMGVYIEPAEHVLGVGTFTVPSRAHHFVSRTKPEGERSGPGDTDLVVYSLRKYMTLATRGNPSILTMLYAPDDAVLLRTTLGDELRALAPDIVSAYAGHRYLGYLDEQRTRMTGSSRSHVPNRPELVEAYGYDTKYASHALRLGLQGIQLMTEGHLSLPMPSPYLDLCMEIKRGQVGFDEALARIDRVRSALAEIMASRAYVVPAQPDWERVNAWLVHAHQNHWLFQPGLAYQRKVDDNPRGTHA